ncbi:MAG: envelope stress response membrane protein PspC [Sphingomonas sp.]|uniref:envelope stress response membrane protein PspC n=1 Tax=Sphingomonas sp. TaxID=28214 RepID=UPI0017F9C139|nr:envelope stress response membrane protein PspC [Sphingomonas sp.]MBA3666163.1 envelope stress response membrane protein PspC [Sphingomonas sp.]
MSQPPSRTKFYLDKRHKKFLGVCSGIANYTGLDVSLVRIGFVAAVVIGGGALLPVYFIAAWIADDEPREIASDSKDERRFWQGVRASPGQSARDIRGRMRDIDRRLADIEHYVTTENRSLAHEIDSLR